MSIAAIGAVTQATQTAQVVQASVAAAQQQQSQNAMLQQDTASISEAGRASLAHDGDGDGH
jgi:hypothetical protein